MKDISRPVSQQWSDAVTAWTRPDYYENLAADALMLAATKMASTTNTAATATKVATESAKEGTQALKPLGLGSTGRTTSVNLTEQLAMKEVMSNPSAGKVLIQTMKDASGRWNDWSKMSNRTAHGIEIHYNALWENGVIKAIDDFKFIGEK